MLMRMSRSCAPACNATPQLTLVATCQADGPPGPGGGSGTGGSSSAGGGASHGGGGTMETTPAPAGSLPRLAFCLLTLWLLRRGMLVRR